MGAWISYALGSLKDNLPTFVVLPDPRGLPYNQRGCFSSGFLPAVHQGTVISANANPPVPDLFASSKFGFATRDADAAGLDLLNDINRRHAATRADDSRLEARIASYELAAKMELSAPEAFDISRESDSLRKSYGIDEPATDDFGRRCLLAARLAERGVRFVQVWSGPQGATNNWDNHGSIPAELPPMALSVDKPIAALLRDLKSRGLDKTRWSCGRRSSVEPHSLKAASAAITTAVRLSHGSGALESKQAQHTARAMTGAIRPPKARHSVTTCTRRFYI